MRYKVKSISQKGYYSVIREFHNLEDAKRFALEYSEESGNPSYIFGQMETRPLMHTARAENKWSLFS